MLIHTATRSLTVVLPAVLLAVVMKAQTANIGAPVWTQIETSGEETEYMLYSSTGATEYVSTAAPWLGTGSNIDSSPRPPHTFNFSDISFTSGTSVPRSVCPAATPTISNNLSNFNWGNWNSSYSGTSSAYWQKVYYDASTFPVQNRNGSFADAPPSEFDESFVMSGIYGFTFLGSFNGNSSGTSSSNALEVAYMTDNPCVAGDNEYGFYYDVAQVNGASFGTLYFYYSDLTNCGGACYSSSSYSTQLYQATSPLTAITGLGLNSGGSTMEYYFSAYLVSDSSGSPDEDYKFRVQVVDPYTLDLTTCKINGSSPGYCTVDVPISSNYVWTHFADQIYGENDVNLVTGISVNGDPTNITSTPGLTVEGVWAGK
jgi:hypothetical protein